MDRSPSQKARIDREYRELRVSNPDMFRECVQGAEAIGINHRALEKLTEAERSALLADIEQHIVSIAARAQGIR